MEAPSSFEITDKDKVKETCINITLDESKEEYDIKMTQCQELECISFLILIKDSIHKYYQEVFLKTFTANKAFAQAENLDDVYEVLMSYLQEKKFTLKKEDEKIVLAFEFQILKKSFSFSIDVNLIKRKMTESLMDDILEENKLMKKEILNLKQELNTNITDLKQEIENMKIHINELKIFNKYKLLQRHSFDYKIELIESMGNKKVAINSGDKKKINILDIFSGRIIVKFSVDEETEFKSVINMRDEYLISGSVSKIFIWEFKSGKLLKILDPAPKEIISKNNKTKVILLEDDLFASVKRNDFKVFIWSVNQYSPVKQIDLKNSEFFTIPDSKGGNFYRVCWDMVKYFDNSLAVIFGIEDVNDSGFNKIFSWGSKKFKKIFSIIDFKTGEVKSSFNFKNDCRQIINLDKGRLILTSNEDSRRSFFAFNEQRYMTLIQDPFNSKIYEKSIDYTYSARIENNILAGRLNSDIYIIDTSKDTEGEVIRILNHDEWCYEQDKDSKQLKRRRNYVENLILVDKSYIVSTDDSGQLLVWSI